MVTSKNKWWGLLYSPLCTPIIFVSKWYLGSKRVCVCIFNSTPLNCTFRKLGIIHIGTSSVDWQTIEKSPLSSYVFSLRSPIKGGPMSVADHLGQANMCRTIVRSEIRFKHVAWWFNILGRFVGFQFQCFANSVSSSSSRLLHHGSYIFIFRLYAHPHRIRRIPTPTSPPPPTKNKIQNNPPH